MILLGMLLPAQFLRGGNYLLILHINIKSIIPWDDCADVELSFPLRKVNAKKKENRKKKNYKQDSVVSS